MEEYKLESALTFHSVIAVRATLYKAFREDIHDRFCLDLSEVTYCDSAGLALLIEVKKWCTRSNKIFEVRGISSKTRSLAEFCGIESIL